MRWVKKIFDFTLAILIAGVIIILWVFNRKEDDLTE